MGVRPGGVLYLARDAQLARQVAIRFPDPEHVEYLGREAKLLARVQHENVVALYRLGTVAGMPYIAHEHVEGPTLEELAPHVTRDVALSVLAGLASGLAALHAQGILHRALDPSLVVVAPGGVAKIVDLSLAKSDDQEFSETTSYHERAKQMRFIAPEVLAGRRATKASDLYSLACIARFLEESGGNLMLPESARAWIARALSRVPSERPTSSAELVASLRPEASPSALMKVAQAVRATAEARSRTPNRAGRGGVASSAPAERTTMAWRFIAPGLSVVAHSVERPRRDEWNDFLVDLERDARTAGRGLLLVDSAGGGPGTTQRATISLLFERLGLPFRTAVLGPPVKRSPEFRRLYAIVEACRWSLQDIELFAHGDVRAALRYLEMDDEATFERALRAREELRRRLAGTTRAPLPARNPLPPSVRRGRTPK